jgi:hypothetical protein
MFGGGASPPSTEVATKNFRPPHQGFSSPPSFLPLLLRTGLCYSALGARNTTLSAVKAHSITTGKYPFYAYNGFKYVTYNTAHSAGHKSARNNDLGKQY